MVTKFLQFCEEEDDDENVIVFKWYKSKRKMHIFISKHQLHSFASLWYHNRKNLYSPPISVSFNNIDLFKKNNDLFPEKHSHSCKRYTVASHERMYFINKIYLAQDVIAFLDNWSEIIKQFNKKFIRSVEEI